VANIHEQTYSHRPPAILLGGGIIALSVARSLGKAGVSVSLLDGPSSEARYSKHSRWIPLAYETADASTLWLNWLLTRPNNEGERPMLLPCSDEGLEFLLNNRSALERDYILMKEHDAVLRSMLDKSKTYELAEKLGVPAPKVWHVTSTADLSKILDKITYPCALKPLSSHLFVKHFPTLKMFIVQNREELSDAFSRTQEHHLEMLVTELIPPNTTGYHSYHCFLNEKGEPLFHFTKLKLRQYPNAFGLGTYHVTDWNPEVAEMGLKFLQGVGLRGIGSVEFMRDPRDRKLKLIECNARFTLTTELIRTSGIDLPLLTYSLLAGTTPPPINGYRKNVYAIRTSSDILAFLEARRRGEMTLFQWLRSIAHIQHFLIFSWSDPMPALILTRRFLQKQMKKITKIFFTGKQKSNIEIDVAAHTPLKGGTTL
jgi:predicted ATP-grasp superfamily ATP-dependent carboligase